MISSAKGLEEKLQTGELTLDRPITVEMPYGLRIDVVITHVGQNKPDIYEYTYTLNTLAYRDWLVQHTYLCDGALSFCAKGIQVMVVGGAAKWDKSAFSLMNEDGEQAFLPLIQESIKFVVHRDLFSGEEWEVKLKDSQIAAQTVI